MILHLFPDSLPFRLLINEVGCRISSYTFIVRLRGVQSKISRIEALYGLRFVEIPSFENRWIGRPQFKCISRHLIITVFTFYEVTVSTEEPRDGRCPLNRRMALKVIQGHWKRYCSINHISLDIRELRMISNKIISHHDLKSFLWFWLDLK